MFFKLDLVLVLVSFQYN